MDRAAPPAGNAPVNRMSPMLNHQRWASARAPTPADLGSTNRLIARAPRADSRGPKANDTGIVHRNANVAHTREACRANATAWCNTGKIASRFCVAALSLPGRFTIKLESQIPETPRCRIA